MLLPTCHHAVGGKTPPAKSMPAGKLFIHVGPHKTGTSAVQHALRAHDNSVVIYPKAGIWADGAHHNLVFNFFGDFQRPDVLTSDIKTLFAQIGAEAESTARNIVISSEWLLAYDAGAFIRALRPYLGEATRETEIILVCREHVIRAASLYNQCVKDITQPERRTPGEFLVQSASTLTYGPMIRQLNQAGVPLRVLNYHPAADFVPRFLQHVGFTDTGMLPNEKRNVSLSTKGLIATLAANHAAATTADRALFFRTLRCMKRFYAPSRCIFDRAALEQVAGAFAEDRQFLRHNFSIDLPEADNGADMFFLTQPEMADIEVASAGLGAAGKAIAAFAQHYEKG